MDLAGRLGAEVHDEVGPAQRQPPDPRTTASDIVCGVVPAGRLERGNDFQRPVQNAPPGLQFRQ